jgi:hypothetical protein
LSAWQMHGCQRRKAVGLMSLKDFPTKQKNNAALFERNRAPIASVRRQRLLAASGVSFSNYQYACAWWTKANLGSCAICYPKLPRVENDLARRYFCPSAHRSVPWSRISTVRRKPFEYGCRLRTCSSISDRRTGHQLGHREGLQLLCRVQMQSHDTRAALES